MARPAGIAVASSETSAITATTLANTPGSVGLTANSCARRTRESASDVATPVRDGALRPKEGVLRQELRVAAREALRQIEGR